MGQDNYFKLFVSSTGDDTMSGRSAAPDGGDGPVATVGRALKLAEEARRGESSLPVAIYLREGVYRVVKPLTIRETLSGTGDYPTILRSYPGERAVLSGGVVLDGFTRLTDRTVKRRLTREAGNNVLVCDLGALGIRNFGSINPVLGTRPELYHNGTLTRPARFPNDGWLLIESVPQTGEKMIYAGLDRDKSAVPRGRHYGRFTYPGDRPSRWAPSGDIWVHGYWTWDWADEYLRVASIDTELREVTPGAPHHRYGYTAGQRFAFINVLEELDAPGEWYLDRARRLLYYWPIEPIEPGAVVFSVLSEPLITIKRAENVRIESLGFEAGRGSALRIEGGAGSEVVGSRFRNFGGTVVVVEGGESHRIVSCDIHDVGAAGVSVQGGDRRTLKPGGHVVENNHIYRFAQRIRTYQPAVQVGGVGNRVAHNVIHNAPHMGVNIDGNDHVIEFNEVFNIATETGDVGAFYMGRDWTERGVVFRYNFIHDLAGPGALGAMGIYLDDAASGAEIVGNLFYRASRAILLGGGRDTVVSGNVFVGCEPSVHLDARGLGWASSYIARGGSWRMYAKLASVGYDRDPYRTRYPALAAILDDDPAVPAGNTIVDNLSTGGRWLDIGKRVPKDAVVIERNLVGKDPEVERFVGELAQRSTASGEVAGNVPDRPQFESIPVSRIGLYVDEYRK